MIKIANPGNLDTCRSLCKKTKTIVARISEIIKGFPLKHINMKPDIHKTY